MSQEVSTSLNKEEDVLSMRTEVATGTSSSSSQRRLHRKRCCGCQGPNARCTNCACVKAGTLCTDCWAGEYDQCCNRTIRTLTGKSEVIGFGKSKKLVKTKSNESLITATEIDTSESEGTIPATSRLRMAKGSRAKNLQKAAETWHRKPDSSFQLSG